MKDWWTVVGYYADNMQPCATYIKADTAKNAGICAVDEALLNQDCVLVVVGVIEGIHDVH